MNQANRPKQPKALPNLSEAVSFRPLESVFLLTEKVEKDSSLRKGPDHSLTD